MAATTCFAFGVPPVFATCFAPGAFFAAVFGRGFCETAAVFPAWGAGCAVAFTVDRVFAPFAETAPPAGALGAAAGAAALIGSGATGAVDGPVTGTITSAAGGSTDGPVT